MEEANSMSERILHTLENIIKNDPELTEFSIVPCEVNNQNKSPILYEEHCIALESWCKKYILNYTYRNLFKNRVPLKEGKLSHEKMRNLEHLLIGALLLTPSHTTFWNMRRELVNNDVLSLKNELFFTKLVLSNNSKSAEAFAYRRWVVCKFLKEKGDSEEFLNGLLEQELLVTEMAAEKSPNNYHSWTYRLWAMETIGKKCPTFGNILINQLHFSIQWIERHISEHTGYHYRKYLIETLYLSKNNILLESYLQTVVKHPRITKIIQVNSDFRSILNCLLGKPANFQNALEDSYKFINVLTVLLFDLLVKIPEFNERYPDHESLWSYRKFIIHFLLKTGHDFHFLTYSYKINIQNTTIPENLNVNILESEILPSLNLDKVQKNPSDKFRSSNLFKLILDLEKEFISNNLNCQSIQLNNLARRHLKWLNCVL